MITIPVQIVLHGLMALVPTDGAISNHMWALLADARTAPTDPTCWVRHEPTVSFPTESRQCTDVPSCTPEGEFCICKLDRQEISIEPDSNPTKSMLEPKPRRGLPFDEAAAGSFAYVGNLGQLGYTVEPALLSATAIPAPLLSKLVARFQFPFESATACELATRRDERADYVHPLNFRRLRSEEQLVEVSQALAQKVVALVDVQVDESQGQVLKLVLKPLPGSTGPRHEFTLPTDGIGILIEVANDRPPFMLPDEVCDDGIGRDFAFLYDFAQNPPAWGTRPVPHVKYSLAKSAKDLDPEVCKKFKDPMSRPICPMGSFNPGS